MINVEVVSSQSQALRVAFVINVKFITFEHGGTEGLGEMSRFRKFQGPSGA
jgi:hypothetical protein